MQKHLVGSVRIGIAVIIHRIRGMKLHLSALDLQDIKDIVGAFVDDVQKFTSLATAIHMDQTIARTRVYQSASGVFNHLCNLQIF